MRAQCLLLGVLFVALAGCRAANLETAQFGKKLLQQIQGTCDADDYKSRVRVQYVSSTSNEESSSFTFKLVALKHCQAVDDVNGCCEADVREIWVDIATGNRVTSVKLNGNNAPEWALDTDGSLRITLPSQPRLKDIASGLHTLEITVEGRKTLLCGQSALVPVRNLCQFILVGGNKKQCCPVSVTRTTAPQSTELYDKSDSFSTCFGGSRERSNSVAHTKFDRFEFNDTHTTVSFTHTSADLSCGWEAYFKSQGARSAIVHAQDRPVDVTYQESSFRWIFNQEAGNTSTYTIIVPGKHVSVSSLCSSKSDLYPNQAEGECVFLKQSKTGSQVVVVKFEPAHDGTPGCSPVAFREPKNVNLKVAYYSSVPSATSTVFYFQVSVGAACPLEPCNGLCGWSLFLKSSITKGLAEDTGVFRAATHALVTTGANSSVTWTLEQVTNTQKYYKLTVPGNVNLRSLCAQNVLTGQGNAECAAVLRTKDYSVRVFFSEADKIVKGQGVYMCEQPKPLQGSCASVTPSHTYFNTPSTTHGFTLGFENSGECASNTNDDYQLQVFLKPGHIDELRSSKAYGPVEPVSLTTETGIIWRYNKVDAHVLYGLSLKNKIDFASLCEQDMYGDQPAGSCVVELKTGNTCFRGFLRHSNLNSALKDYRAPSLDGTDVVIKSNDLSKGEIAGIVIGVVVPVILAGIAAGIWFTRRSRARQNKYSVQDPLVDGAPAAP